VVPDITSVDESTAKILLAQKMLIPNIEYEFNDLINEGSVIKTDPEIGSNVTQDQKIIVYISKGPKKITSKSASVEWASPDDKFEFYAPYIDDETLVIDSEMTFSKKYILKDFSKNNAGYGRASITDTFSKTVPLSIEKDDETFEAKTLEAFTIKIPISDLEVRRPTTIYLEFYLENRNYTMNFSISW
jgi:hypothetical protein